jgi:hypothetical protein
MLTAAQADPACRCLTERNPERSRSQLKSRLTRSRREGPFQIRRKASGKAKNGMTRSQLRRQLCAIGYFSTQWLVSKGSSADLAAWRLWLDKSASMRRRGLCGLSRRRNPSNADDSANDTAVALLGAPCWTLGNGPMVPRCASLSQIHPLSSKPSKPDPA